MNVSPSGTDGPSCGTSSNPPCATLRAAYLVTESFTSSNEIVLADGIYSGPDNVGVRFNPTNQLVIRAANSVRFISSFSFDITIMLCLLSYFDLRVAGCCS